MEMTYDGAIVMPSNCALMDVDEMTYVEGGKSTSANFTLKYANTYFATMMEACTVGEFVSAFDAAFGSHVGGTLSALYLARVVLKATDCYNKVQSWLHDSNGKYNNNTLCKITRTTAANVLITDLKVRVL